jgi:hypothetical protein
MSTLESYHFAGASAPGTVGRVMTSPTTARRAGPTIFGLLVAAALAGAPGAAQARDLLVAPGTKGQLSFDQISGFRATLLDGFGYSGLLGGRYDRQSVDVRDGKRVVSSLSLWIAPSADYFVIDHLSLGGLVEVTRTSASVEFPINPNTTQTVDLPTTLSFTILPRVGYMLSPSNRFAIWPRIGAGYFTKQEVDSSNNPAASTRAAFSGVIVDLDVGLLYRPTEEFFLRAAPEIAFSVAGSRSSETNGVKTSVDASFFQAGLSAGIGVLID